MTSKTVQEIQTGCQVPKSLLGNLVRLEGQVCTSLFVCVCECFGT
uniref:Uncharacterized protein n=1 Tax=Rhizophora mucronata TaxID=61149 RepID=A0A2P2R027_RHIMU